MKDFLKLTGNKVVFALLISLVISIYSVNYGFGEKVCQSGGIGYICEQTINPFLFLPIYLHYIFLTRDSSVPTFVTGHLINDDRLMRELILITSPYWILISYLFSCLLVYFLKLRRSHSANWRIAMTGVKRIFQVQLPHLPVLFFLMILQLHSLDRRLESRLNGSRLTESIYISPESTIKRKQALLPSLS